MFVLNKEYNKTILPKELWNEIIFHLDLKDLSVLLLTASIFNVNDDTIYRCIMNLNNFIFELINISPFLANRIINCKYKDQIDKLVNETKLMYDREFNSKMSLQCNKKFLNALFESDSQMIIFLFELYSPYINLVELELVEKEINKMPNNDLLLNKYCIETKYNIDKNYKEVHIVSFSFLFGSFEIMEIVLNWITDFIKSCDNIFDIVKYEWVYFLIKNEYYVNEYIEFLEKELNIGIYNKYKNAVSLLRNECL